VLLAGFPSCAHLRRIISVSAFSPQQAGKSIVKKFPHGNCKYVDGDINTVKEFVMNKKRIFPVMLVCLLAFGLILTGCLTPWEGAVYEPAQDPAFNQDNVAKGLFFTLDTGFRDSVDGLCFVVNLGTFPSSYQLRFNTTGQSVILNTADARYRDVVVLPPGIHGISLLRNGEAIATNSTNEKWVAGGYYYIAKDTQTDFPMFYVLSATETVSWGGQEISGRRVIDGIKAAVALEFGWHVTEAESAPATDTLEKRSSSNRDREGTSLTRYISRNGSNLNTGTWYVFANDAIPGETFYAFSEKKGIFTLPWDIYRKL
jgi:hypothetical protein